MNTIEMLAEQMSIEQRIDELHAGTKECLRRLDELDEEIRNLTARLTREIRDTVRRIDDILMDQALRENEEDTGA